jgi:copper chaperone CopZ
VNSVRATLSKLDGVKEVKVDRSKKIAKITLKEKATLSKETVSAAFNNTRFKVTSYAESMATQPEKTKLT